MTTQGDPFQPLDDDEPDTMMPLFPGWKVEFYEVCHLQVEVHTNPSQTTAGYPIITFHDIGQNASTFARLYVHSRRASLELESTPVHCHIQAPGHRRRSSDVPSDADFSLQGLSHSILSVLDRAGLTRVVGIGVGAGANVFLRAAGERPRAFAGLVLISPDLHASHLGERIVGSINAAMSRSLGLTLTRYTKDALLSRWLSTEKSEELVTTESIESNLDKLNPRNISRFIVAESWRDGVADAIKKLDSHILFVTGRESTLRHHTADALSKLDPVKTSWLDVHGSGSLPHEEMPAGVAQSVTLFLQGLPGYH